MIGYRQPLSSFLQHFLPWFMLVVLLLFTYAFFFTVPYAGFRYRPTGQVATFYVTPAPQADLRIDDRLIQVGTVLWDDFSRDFGLTLFDGVEPGDIVPLVVERDDVRLTISWVFPGPNSNEFIQRLSSDWFLGYFFWLAGTLVFLSVRPKDTRWNLLIAFYYVTALWLITGSGASSAHVWGSALVLQTAVWLSVPIYWQLHWIMPQPLRHLPKVVWWIVYGIAGVLAGAAWLGLIPGRLYAYGLLLSLLGAAILLLFHLIFRPAQRRDMRLLVFLAVLTLAPFIAVNGAQLAGIALPFYSVGASLLTFPLLPLAYFYTLYRRRLGGMELRRNRLLTLYLFIILLGSAFIIAYTLASTWFNFPGDRLFIGLSVSLLATLVTIFGYARFQRFVERRLLGVPPAPTHLLETYAARIATRLDRTGLVNLLRDEILPGLLVRQSALFSLDEARRMTILYRSGVDDNDLPADQDIRALLAEAGAYRPPASTEAMQRVCAWVHLALALRVSDQIIGLWLLGHRDPDDEYARSEVIVLQALADQSAIALAHIIQSDLLRAAYKADIDRMETERASLGRQLHDRVLGDLAKLKEKAERVSASSDFLETYEGVTTSLRQTITGLRPAMLNYGLRAALNSLVDLLAERAQHELIIELNVPETDVRFEANLEQHFYRIVQQACENALRHARARKLIIHGQLNPQRIDLIVEDDGIGFEVDEHLDLAGLLARQHFGLAGIYERADLIRAQLLLDSTAGRGTRVRVIWSAHER